MFSGPEGEARLRALRMCEDCRLEVAINEAFDRHAGPQRPAPRMAEDYLALRGKTDELQ
jgi:hypothetical protein